MADVREHNSCYKYRNKYALDLCFTYKISCPEPPNLQIFKPPWRYNIREVRTIRLERAVYAGWRVNQEWRCIAIYTVSELS
jgi:hypothetical protein